MLILTAFTLSSALVLSNEPEKEKCISQRRKDMKTDHKEHMWDQMCVIPDPEEDTREEQEIHEDIRLRLIWEQLMNQGLIRWRETRLSRRNNDDSLITCLRLHQRCVWTNLNAMRIYEDYNIISNNPKCHGQGNACNNGVNPSGVWQHVSQQQD